jgi:hypothetical protein
VWYWLTASQYLELQREEEEGPVEEEGGPTGEEEGLMDEEVSVDQFADEPIAPEQATVARRWETLSVNTY